MESALTPRLRARVLVLALVATAVIGLAPSTTPAAAAATPIRTEAQQIIAIARAQLGDRFRMAAVGPRSFDCSGLVIYAYTKAGDGRVIHAGDPHFRTARQMYLWFKAHGKASRHDPKQGDLVVWGGGHHIGIYLGNGYAISTLERGVRVHKVSAFNMPFTAYLHTGMNAKVRRG